MIEPLRNRHKVILLGDFNIDLLKDNNFSKEFQDMLQSNYLVPTILEPTRVATINRHGEDHTTETLIDNIFINRSTDFKSGLIYSSISDHYPFFSTILNCNINSLDRSPKLITSKLIDDFRKRKFKSSLQRACSNLLNSMNDPQAVFSNFISTFDSL